MIGAIFLADIVDVPSAGVVVFELVEGACHDSIGEVEGLLYSVTMMDVDINVQDALKSFQQLQDGQNTIINVAKT